MERITSCAKLAGPRRRLITRSPISCIPTVCPV